MEPITVTGEHGLDIGPHPHMGLAAATWLIEGKALHRDSLGTEQLLSAGQPNLMTAGHGVAHAEEATRGYDGRARGGFIDPHRSWAEDDGRFGTVASPLAPIETTPPRPKNDEHLSDIWAMARGTGDSDDRE